MLPRLPVFAARAGVGIRGRRSGLHGELVVETLPAHPLGWLRLAEAAASGDPQQLGVLPQHLQLAGLDELNALARAWCAHAARLAGEAPDIMRRVAHVEMALGRRDMGFWRQPAP